MRINLYDNGIHRTKDEMKAQVIRQTPTTSRHPDELAAYRTGDAPALQRIYAQDFREQRAPEAYKSEFLRDVQTMDVDELEQAYDLKDNPSFWSELTDFSDFGGDLRRVGNLLQRIPGFVIDTSEQPTWRELGKK